MSQGGAVYYDSVTNAMFEMLGTLDAVTAVGVYSNIIVIVIITILFKNASFRFISCDIVGGNWNT